MSSQEIQYIHRGQALKKAVYESGIKISVLARKIEKSRRFIYIMFDNKDVPISCKRVFYSLANRPH